MSLAVFRITKVDGQTTSLAPDPFIQVGFHSPGKIGTALYKNEPVHLVAAPRRSGYPGTRWVVLAASQLQIGAVLHTEHYDLLIDKGQFADFKIFGGGGMEVFTVVMKVQSAATIGSGAMWSAMQQYHVGRETPKEEGIVDDVRKLRGRKLARRAAGWIWDRYFD